MIDLGIEVMKWHFLIGLITANLILHFIFFMLSASFRKVKLFWFLIVLFASIIGLFWYYKTKTGMEGFDTFNGIYIIVTVVLFVFHLLINSDKEGLWSGFEKTQSPAMAKFRNFLIVIPFVIISYILLVIFAL